MSTLSERLRSPQSVIGISLSVVAASLLGYAVYFDHQRRHNPAFRRRLQRQQSKLDKSVKAESTRRRNASENELRRRLDQEDPSAALAGGSSPESQEAYFLEQVGQGEQLVLRGPNEYANAAVHFFRALKVYPAPHELLNIYQKVRDVTLSTADAPRLNRRRFSTWSCWRCTRAHLAHVVADRELHRATDRSLRRLWTRRPSARAQLVVPIRPARPADLRRPAAPTATVSSTYPVPTLLRLLLLREGICNFSRVDDLQQSNTSQTLTRTMYSGSVLFVARVDHFGALDVNRLLGRHVASDGGSYYAPEGYLISEIGPRHLQDKGKTEMARDAANIMRQRQKQCLCLCVEAPI